jgi:hypothetical protein
VGTDVGLYLLQFVAARGAQDLLSTDGKPLQVWEEAVQDHHLIPLGSVTTVGQSTASIRKGTDELSRLLNSPLNRAYVLADTNRRLSDMEISRYMAEVTGQVKKSLLFATEDFSRQDAESDLEFARRMLGGRFDSIAMTASNHLTALLTI